MSENQSLLYDLALQRSALLRAVEGLSAEEMQMPGASEPAWSAQDVLAHIAAWERQTVEALRAYVNGDEPYHTAGFDNLADRDRWSEEEVSQRRNWPVHETLLELGTVRCELLQLLARLTETQLGERIEYPWGKRGTLSHLLRASIDHEQEHAEALSAWRATLQAPQVRTAMRPW